MTRNLKTLGLALIAVLALSAVVASAASAAPKLTPEPEEYPVTVKGSQNTPIRFELEGLRATECATFTLEGTIASKAEAEKSELTLTPSTSECTTTILGNKDPATITWNGCKYRFTISEAAFGTPLSQGWEFTGTEVHFECPPGAVVEHHVFASKEKLEKNESLCTWHAAPQTVGGDVDYKGTLAANWTITFFGWTKTSGTTTNCGAASQSGSISGEVKLELFNSKSEKLKAKFDKE